MKYPKIEKGVFEKSEDEARVLTQDEYFELSELLKKFAKNETELYLMGKIENFIDRFSAESDVALHFENWSKDDTSSDSYMALIGVLNRVCKLAYSKSYFKLMI